MPTKGDIVNATISIRGAQNAMKGEVKENIAAAQSIDVEKICNIKVLLIIENLRLNESDNIMSTPNPDLISGI